MKPLSNVNIDCKILQPDNNSFIFKEEVYFNITKGSVLVFYLEALSPDLTSFQHSHWLSLLRCLLLQVKAKLMNNVRD